MASLGFWIFARHIGAETLPIPDVALVTPVCVWSLVRWGARGNSVTSAALCLMLTLAALHQRGPFVREAEFWTSSSVILALANSLVFSVTMWLAGTLLMEQRRAEVAIRKSDVRYRILFQNSPDAVFVVDPVNGELLEFNDRLPAMLKCTQEALRGARRVDFEVQTIPLSDRSSIISSLNPKTIDVDAQYCCFNGEVIDVNVTYSGIEYFGRPASLMIARDVTARRKAEQQLRESEEKFRALAESLPAMVTIQRDSRPLYVNPAAAALSGYSLDELQQRDVVDLLRHEYRPEARKQVHQCLTKSRAWRREVSLCTKAGQERQIDLSVTPITLEGRPAWLASAMDVTEQRQAEAELRQLNAELFHSARLRLLGEFVAGVAHDLKHPIGAIDHLASGIINRLNNSEPLTTENLQAEFETVL
ncbi:MAG TPA: PAS domain S-box protein, partial [Planctomycetaceae bacterium]|nr:PAS domain S-box protein [Planctomycetaceae bacterium]